MSLSKILENRYVLYIVLFIAVSNILGYLAIQDYQSLTIFIALTILTSYFSKNMIVIMGVALVGTNIMFANRQIREPLKNKGGSKKKKKQGFTQNNIPSSKPERRGARPATEDEEDEVDGGGRVDYASTMEQAYDNLNKLLGDGGMKNLTNDTQSLMNQQKELMSQLNNFAPLMNQASDMLEKLGGMDNLQGLMGKLGGLKGLSGGKKK